MTEGSDIKTLTQCCPADLDEKIHDRLVLTAEERQRSRYRCQTEGGVEVLLNLPRGSALTEGDCLTTEAGDWWVQIGAKPEMLLCVQSKTPLDLLRAAYHLGNRHVPLELTAQTLKLSPDPVLREMLVHLGLTVTDTLEPFYPEPGAYGHLH
ncbi:MAG: urease accessory protein UreE [Thermosynechococcaceae cyanobacterium]